MIISEFLCNNGRNVTLEIDEDNDYQTNIFDDQRNHIGEMKFRSINEDRGLKLIRSYHDLRGKDWLRQGIGRECLQKVKEYSGLPIFAEYNDGSTKADGSHLTGDAPSFIERMREESIVER